ncbi:hypothetical protein DFH09DRAFT_927156 [Mycena vulgaris]|nr:hypothetical protein DFH09DRAFT_927156 [Mycena vulgaris]
MQNPLSRGADSPPTEFWEWTGNYLCLDVHTEEQRETRQLFVAEIPGVLVHPVRPSISKPVGSDDSEQLPTWSIPTKQLMKILEHAWQSLDPLGKDILSNVAQLSEVNNPNCVPYCDALGESTPYFSLGETKLRAADKILCFICGAERKLNTMRDHVARHILLSLRGIKEPNQVTPVGSDPCGFCRLNGCFTQLVNWKHPKKAVSIKSTCRYHYSRMNYKQAKIASNRSLSTNVPIPCALFSGDPQTIWKYNTMYHIISEHSLQDNILPPIPPEFMVDLFIRKSEEDSMGIQEAETVQWRKQNHIPDSDIFDSMYLDSTAPAPNPSKRGRAGTVSTASDISDSDKHTRKK